MIQKKARSRVQLALACLAALITTPDITHANQLSNASAFVSGIEAFRTGDFKTAYQEFLSAAEEGHIEAQFMLGEMYRTKRGVPTSYAKAVHWYTEAAEQGHVQAQVALGVLYAVAGNEYKKAAHWYRQAAENGNAHGQRGLGLLYLNGRGVSQNYQEAYFWLVLAAANGDTTGLVYRDEAQSKLTKADIAAVQARASQWRPSEQQ